MARVLKIDIKGIKYDFHLVDIIGNDSNIEGETNTRDKTIYIKKDNDIDNLGKTILHEMYHALFYECGRPCECRDEELIEFLSYNFYYMTYKFNLVVDKFEKLIKGEKNEKNSRKKI